MGIPDAMLPEVKRFLGKDVSSSPPEAEKRWQSFSAKGARSISTLDANRRMRSRQKMGANWGQYWPCKAN